MTHIAISVEGQTEMSFCTNVLYPYLDNKYGGIIVSPIALYGHVSRDRIKKEVGILIKNRSYHIVTTFYDYYGLHKRWSDDPLVLEGDMVSWLSDRDSYRFIPYIQMYEFEALVFSDPNKLCLEFDRIDKVSEIINLVSQKGGAEKINDSVHTAPSKRIRRIFPDFDKVYHGTKITNEIGIEKLREECPKFSAWISLIEGKIQAFRGI